MDEVNDIIELVLPTCPFVGGECPHDTQVSDAYCLCCLLGTLVRETKLLRVTGQG